MSFPILLRSHKHFMWMEHCFMRKFIPIYFEALFMYKNVMGNFPKSSMILGFFPGVLRKKPLLSLYIKEILQVLFQKCIKEMPHYLPRNCSPKFKKKTVKYLFGNFLQGCVLFLTWIDSNVSLAEVSQNIIL